MKILFASHSYYPIRNGVQAVTQYLAEGLVKKNHYVEVLTESSLALKKNEIINGVSIKRFPLFSWHGIHYGKKAQYREYLVKNGNDFDLIVFMCLLSPETDFAFSVLSHIHTKKVLYVHGMPNLKLCAIDFKSIYQLLNKLYKILLWHPYLVYRRRDFRKFDKIVHLHECDDAYKFFIKHHIGNNTVIMNAVDDVFFLAKKMPIVSLPTRYIICVANYSERKNQIGILKAFYQAKTADYALVLIGSIQNEYYYKMIKMKGLYEKRFGRKNVQILTDIPREDIYRYVGNAKIVLQGSAWEAFSISIIEAMACGIPFISTDVGINRFLPGGCVINISEMKYWIEMFINDEDIRNRYGKIALSYAKKNLTILAKVEQIENMF